MRKRAHWVTVCDDCLACNKQFTWPKLFHTIASSILRFSLFQSQFFFLSKHRRKFARINFVHSIRNRHIVRWIRSALWRRPKLIATHTITPEVRVHAISFDSKIRIRRQSRKCSFTIFHLILLCAGLPFDTNLFWFYFYISFFSCIEMVSLGYRFTRKQQWKKIRTTSYSIYTRIYKCVLPRSENRQSHRCRSRSGEIERKEKQIFWFWLLAGTKLVIEGWIFTSGKGFGIIEHRRFNVTI